MKVDIFSKMFEFYLTSHIHFQNMAESILIFLHEEGDCGNEGIIEEGIPEGWEWYHFESKFARRCKQRIEAERGFYFQLTEEEKKEYFSNIANEDILFCVMYAHWVGVNKRKINYIKKAKTEKTAKKRLKESLPIENIYYINLPEETISAHKIEENILLAENGNRYEII